jgi:hypothetical protein
MLPLAGDRKPVKYLATPAEELHGNFSPDGHYVAYTSNESGRFEVYVETYPRSDRKWTVSTNGGYEPRCGDGREIYYLSEDRRLMAVPVGVGPQFEAPVPLFQTGGRHAPAHALCAFARWQTIPGEHAQRRAIAHTDHSRPQLDCRAEEVTPGTKLGPCEIVAKIGSGDLNLVTCP